MAHSIPAPADVASIPSDAIQTPSGLAYRILKSNPNGETLTPQDWVKIHYTGWTTDGKMFDSSLGGPEAVFPLSNLIAGMTEAIALGKTGEALRAWIPEELAYQGMPGMPAGMLVFDFDIVEKVTPKKPAMSPTASAISLGEGLSYEISTRGDSSENIREKDIVVVDFMIWSKEREQCVVSSYEQGEPLCGQVKSLFPGLRKTIVHAHKGDKLTIWIPQKFGVDPTGRSLSGLLVMNLEIHDVTQGPKAIEAPSDVAAAPAEATVTASGLAYQILTPGTGTAHPKATSRVRVHYTGWTTDGEMFDSSVARGEPSEFNLNQVIPGWTEGVQRMVEGEKMRFWIPEKLAYNGMKGAPAGMLVFDVELIAIV